MLKAIIAVRGLAPHRRPNSSSNFFPRPLSPFFLRRQFSLSNIFAKNSKEKIHKNVQPLSTFFQELVGEGGGGNNAVKSQGDREVEELKERLRTLEEQVRSLKKEACPRPVGKSIFKKATSSSSGEEIVAKRSLSSIFSGEKTEMESIEPIVLAKREPRVHKVLSSGMQSFAQHLYSKGYFKGANFIRKNQLDPTSFEGTYACEYFRSAADNFGKDHPEVTRWLSTSNLKKIALFGCPSQDRRGAYAAKYLRGFFKIKEEVVCQKCMVKNSCKHANQKPQKDSSKLKLSTVTRVLVDYGLNLVPQELVVPEEIGDSVDQLLKEIISLSSNGSSDQPGTPCSHHHNN